MRDEFPNESVERVDGTTTALAFGVAADDETIPPASGEVEAAMKVVLCSRRARLVGVGDAVIARDVADLLLAIDDQHRTTIVVDAADSPIELRFFARLARDFPANVAVLVQGTPSADRRAFHEQGVYRAQFDPSEDGVIPEDGTPIDRGTLAAKVMQKLQRSPTPLIALKGR